MANEIELMVSIRRQGDAGVLRRGDVMTCRLAGGKWGTQELKTHQVVLWPGENPTELEENASMLLQAILHKKADWGEPNPRVDYPFCEIVHETPEDDNGSPMVDFDNQPIENVVMTNRSILHFDFTSLPQGQLDAVLNKSVSAEFISADDVSVSVDERGVDKREPSQRGKKSHRNNASANPVLHANDALRRDETTDTIEFLSRKVEPIKSWRV